MTRIPLAFFFCCLVPIGFSQQAVAQHRLEALPELHRACRDARTESRPQLYVANLERFSFGAHEPSAGVLPIDTQRNLVVFGGAAELYPSGHEAIMFPATQARAHTLAQEARRLRVGFFLSFDGGQACLIRPASAVTMVRIDLAFTELLDEDGHVLAREDTERLRAWRDDEVPAAGLVIEAADVDMGVEVSAMLTSRRASLTACFAGAASRLSDPSQQPARVILRVRVASGTIAGVEVEFSSLGDQEGLACLRAALVGQTAVGTGSARVPLTYSLSR